MEKGRMEKGRMEKGRRMETRKQNTESATSLKHLQLSQPPDASCQLPAASCQPPVASRPLDNQNILTDISTMRIAIFSGSFNPIHNGHLAISQAVIAQGAADELWFLVSPRNPFKLDKDLWPETDRLEMVKLAIENMPWMQVSDFEFNLPRPSYTINTLEGLRESYPQHQFRLLIGGDNLAIFHKWYEYQKIINEFGLIVYPRPHYPIDSALKSTNITIISAPFINLSATEIRSKLSKGESIAEFVPNKVAKFINLHL